MKRIQPSSPRPLTKEELSEEISNEEWQGRIQNIRDYRAHLVLNLNTLQGDAIAVAQQIEGIDLALAIVSPDK